MHRERRTSSKVCQQKWDEHNQAIHADKLRSIKPSIDNSPPKAQKHLQNRRKRDQIKEDRLATIERDNLLLLDKMMNIMQKPSATTMTMSGGGGGGGRSMSPSKSLNSDARRREFQRINDDNQMILKKLTTAKSHYDRKEWEQFETNQTKYLENICEYPVQKHLPKISTSLPQIRSSSRVNTKSFSSPERSAPSSPTLKKKATHQIKQKGPTKEYSQEQQYFSDDSLSLSDLDSASDEEFLKGIAKLETKPTNGKENKNKKEDAGSDADSLGSDFSDSFEDESDHEGNAKSASPKSENDLDSPKANSARKDSRPDSAKSGSNEVGTPKSGRGEVHALKSSGEKPASARSNGSNGLSSARDNKSTGSGKEHKKIKEEESEDEEEYENEFEDEDEKD